eukprot:m.43991 g.43991  ORF g.43991 m.43991 type:complete len:54 (-) comp14878_c0_seq1:1512-1673(-)
MAMGCRVVFNPCPIEATVGRVLSSFVRQSERPSHSLQVSRDTTDSSALVNIVG